MKKNSQSDFIRARRLLMILGLAFIGVALYGYFNPHEMADYATPITAAIGIGLISLGKFGSNRVVETIETLLTGWW